MKITFETEINDQDSTELDISPIEKGVFINVSYCVLGNQQHTQTHFLNKQELKEFIGALLHIQSNLNKVG